MSKKKIKLDNRVKKMANNSNWTRNVLKSMGFTSDDLIRDLMPNTADFMNSNSQVTDIIKDIRGNITKRKVMGTQMKTIPGLKTVETVFNNIKDDLKSGNFNNRDRENSFGDDSFDFGFDDNMFGDEGLVEFLDDDSSPSNTPPTIIDTMPLAKAINGSTEATVNTMIAVADQNMAIQTEKLLFDHKSSTAMLNGLTSINDNLATLVRFNADSTAKYHAASMKFYEEMHDFVEKSTKKENDYDWSSVNDIFDSSGNVKISDYINRIKGNMKDKKDESMWGFFLDNLTNPMMLEGFVKNPIGTITRMAVPGLVNAGLKKSLKSLDDAMNSIIPAALARINTFDGELDGKLDNIFKIFNAREKLEYDVKLDKYEKGAIQWDGESKKALVEVIPTYLRRIESALTGEDERVFDYDKGNFLSIRDVKKRHQDNLKEKEVSGYLDTRIKLEDLMRELSGSFTLEEGFTEDLDKIFSTMTKQGYHINHNKRRDKNGNVRDDLLDIFEGDRTKAELFRTLFNQLSKKDLTRMATIELNDSRKSTQRYIDEVNAGTLSSGANYIYNNSYFDEKDIDKIKYKNKGGILDQQKDKFGLGQLDYLRDIRKALIHGIKVFPDNSINDDGGSWNPNIDIISREELEVEHRHRDEEVKQRESNDINNVNSKYKDILNMSQDQIDSAVNKVNRVRGPKEYNNPLLKAGQKLTNTIAKPLTNIIDPVTNKVNDFVYELLYGKDNTQGYARGTSFLGTSYEFEGQDYSNKKSMKDRLKSGVGILGGLVSEFMDGFNQFKVSLFGETGTKKDTAKDLFESFKSRLPKALGAGLKGGLIKTLIASKLDPNGGLLSSLILPGGPIGAAMLSMGTSMITQSETFQRIMFGELVDEEGNRAGGVIPSSLIEAYNEYGKPMKKHAGLGVLASFFLPGGPILGAVTGIGAGLLAKSDAFQQFIFGDNYQDKDNRSIMDGAFGKLMKKMTSTKEGNDGNPKLATFLGGAGLFTGIAQGVGFLPSMLLPGGPILGSIFGLSAGIAASSEKFQKFLFGEKDDDGKRSGGILTKFANWFDVNVGERFRVKMAESNDRIYEFLNRKILFPIQDALDPIKQLGLNVLDDIKEAFHNVTDPVVESFKDNVTRPLGEWMREKFLNPITKRLKGIFGMIGKAIGSVVTSPIKLLTGLGNVADFINARGTLKEERKNRRQQLKENIKENGLSGLISGVKNLRISKEEKQRLLTTGKMEYRAKREENRQKREEELQAQMEERQSKTQELQEQFEEDMKFGKGSGWRKPSKRTQEKQAELLKKKQQWLQEQNLIESNKINEKLQMVNSLLESGNVQGEETINTLVDMKNALVDQLKELGEKFKGTNANSDSSMPIDIKEQFSRAGIEYPQLFDVIDGGNESDEYKASRKMEFVERMLKNKSNDDNTVEALNGIKDSLSSKLKELGQSHEDGLDIVPYDGYVAELHEGEMVVPSLPAGKMRDMFSGNDTVSKLNEWVTKREDAEKQDRDDNALGLTDEEATQQKEILDRKRYADISKKGVDYVMNKRAEEQKEKEEKQWKNSILEAIHGVGAGVAAGAKTLSGLGSSLLDGIAKLFDKLGITGLLAGAAGLLGGAAISNYSDIAAQTGNTTLDVIQGKGREERKDVDKNGNETYVYDNQLISGASKLGHLAIKPGSKLVQAGIDTTKGINNAYMKTKSAISKAMGKSGDEVVTGVIDVYNGNVEITSTIHKRQTGIVEDLITMGKKAIKILSDKAVEKFPKLKSITGLADDVFKKIAAASDNVYKKFGTKIATFIADLGLDFTGVGTVVEFGMTAYDILTGYYSGNVGNLFGVPKDHVDMEMRNITAFLQGLCKFSFMAVIWLINEITSSLMGFDFLQNIARWIYMNLPVNPGKEIDLTNNLEGVSIDGLTVADAIEKAGGDTSMFFDKNGKFKADLDDKDLKGTGISSAEYMELQRLNYNNENGTKLDSLAWKDKTSQTFGANIVEKSKKWVDEFKEKSWIEKAGFVAKTAMNPMQAVMDASLKPAGDWIKEKSKPAVDKIKEWGSNAWEATKTGAVNAKNWAVDKFNKTKQNAQEFMADPLTYIGKSTENAYFKGKELVGKGTEWAKEKFKPVSDKLKGVKDKVKDKLSFATEGIDEDDSAGTKAAKVIKNINAAIEKKKQDVLNGLKKGFDQALDNFKNGMNNIVKWFKDLKTTIPKKIDEVKKNIADGFTGMMNSLKDSVTKKVDELRNFFSKENMSKIFNEQKTKLKESWGNFTGSFTKIFDDIKSSFKLPKLTMPDLSVTWDNVKDFFKDFAKELLLKKGAGESGPSTLDKVRPIKYRATDSDFITPTSNTTNNTTTNSNTNNKFVFYNQSDKRWGSNKMGNSTMKESGCGPTSLAMAISQLTGEQITPDTIAKLGQEHLPGYSKFSLFPSVANKLNMNYNEGFDGNFIMSNLQQGIPVILSGRTSAEGTPYTSDGHVVTATKLEGNKIFINDPRGKEYSGLYPLNSVLTGLNKGMAISPSNKTDVSRLSSGHLENGWVGKEYEKVNRNELGIFGDVGEYSQLDENMGKTGAAQVTMADRVLSYARAFLNNTSKFSYSQPRRLQIDTNKSSSKGCGADCSSFVSHVLSRAGDVNIYGTTSQTFWDKVGTKVDEPQIGDVVCQQGHVGLYSGDGNYIHMSGRKAGIKESKAIQRGNNKHRGYKRVLKNPSQMVDPTVPNPNSFLGTVVATSSGQPVSTSGGAPISTGTDTSVTSTPSVDTMGVFGQLGTIGNNMIASIFNGRDMFDVQTTNVNTDNSTGNPDISGISDNAKAVYTFFTGKGYTPEVAAGILGNMTQESNVDPTAIQGGGRGPAAGICQWENYNKKSARWKGLSDYAASKGKAWTDLQSQLEWLDMELQGKDPTTLSLLKKYVGGYEQFKALTDVRKATKVFEDSFERAGKPNMERRYSAAENYYNQFKSSGNLDITAGTGPATATAAETYTGDTIPTSLNGWAYYKQGDPQWQEDISGKKIGPSGCGMASHAMMLTTMFGKQITPVTVGKWARAKGHWSNGMSWGMPGAIANLFGLDQPYVLEKSGGASNSDLEKVKAEIKAGRPVILSGQGQSKNLNSPFTNGGHIVLAVGVDGNNRLIINDPRGMQYTKAYEDSGVMDIGTGLRGAWSFDLTSSSKIPDDWTTGSSFTPGGFTGTTPTDGTTPATSASVDTMGVFSQMSTIGNNMIASIFNGRDMFDVQTNTSQFTNGTLPVGDTTVDETLMLSGQEGFFKALGPSAAAAYNQYHIFPSTTLAQAALESAWGKSRVATTDKNLFGIKWTGNCDPSITVEKGLNCPGNEQGGARPYNRYKSYSDSMVDHGWFLGKNRKRYGPTLDATTPEEQIIQLGKSGYAEASTYASSLQNMIDKYNLTQYNTPTTNNNDNAGMGDGETYWAKGFGDNKINKTSYNKGHAGMGEGETTSKLVNARRNMEKSIREIDRNMNVVNNTTNINNTNVSDACIDMMKVILQELHAINNNTAETAKGVSNIEIVSANEPISGNINTKVKKNTSKPNHSNSNTGYDLARKIASYK